MSFDALEMDLRRSLRFYRWVLKRVVLVFRGVRVWQDPGVGLGLA